MVAQRARGLGYKAVEVRTDLFGRERYLLCAEEQNIVIWDKAQELGRLIGQTPEYQALRRAESNLREDQETRAKLDQIQRLARQVDQMVAQGQMPDQADRRSVRDGGAGAGDERVRPGLCRRTGQLREADDEGEPTDQRRDGEGRYQQYHHLVVSGGFFVVVEGSEGAGKSTLAAGLVRRMQDLGLDPVSVREPGGTPAAEAVRAAFLDPANRFAPHTELLYICAARAHLVQR